MEDIRDIDTRFDKMYDEPNMSRKSNRSTGDELCIEMVERHLAL